MTQTSQRAQRRGEKERKELEECVFIKEGYLFENNGFEKWEMKKKRSTETHNTQTNKTNNHYYYKHPKTLYNNKRTITILHKSSLFFFLSFFQHLQQYNNDNKAL